MRTYLVDKRPVFPPRKGPPVTSEMIERIHDELDPEDATPYDHEADKPMTLFEYGGVVGMPVEA